MNGKSGNPGGRPKELAGIQELARKHAPEAIKTLVRVAAKGKSESAQVAAASALLDRGFGKPPQFNTGDNAAFRKAIEMSDNELASIASGSGEDATSPPIDPAQLN